MEVLSATLGLIAEADSRLSGIVLLSLSVSFSAAILAACIALPLGALLAVGSFPGRQVSIVVINGLMGLPSVVVGLIVYLLLSRAGPLGSLGLLFTPSAMVIAQAVLITPLLAALTRQIIEEAWREYAELLRSLGACTFQAMATLLRDKAYALLTVFLAGFGRAVAEVGAVMIVGGNIDGVTRVMTTTIALETSKGDLPLALALGVILVALVLGINALTHLLRIWTERRYG